jgi:hypothetical protein
VIRPSAFNPKLLATLADCERAFRQARVQLRGWDYPHNPNTGISRHQDYIQGSIHWELHHELWRLYQSGQFVHMFSLREDWLRPSGRMDVEPGKALGTVLTLFTLTEMFLFAARLAEAVPLGPRISLDYRLNRLNGRRLESFDPMTIDLWSGGKAADDLTDFGARIDLPTADFIASASDLAIDQALEIFERFNWSPPRELLLDDQRKLLQQRRI